MKPTTTHITSFTLRRVLLTLLTVVASVLLSIAQERKVTPVESDDKKPPQPTLHYYDKHGNLLKEPVLFLADLDTVKKVRSGPKYPLLNSVDVGVNVFDLAMMAFGQKYAGIDIHGNVSLFNWFFPTVEAGVGFGKNTTDTYTYTAKPSLYLKLGIDYNFLYKSNPAYRAFVGFRAGFSSFRYDVDNVNISSEYWDLTNSLSLTDVSETAFYGQVVAGVKVKLYKNLSMGWTGRYNFMFHRSGNKDSQPWYIPGYGAKNRLTATFSIIYTIPLARQPDAENVQNEVSAN